MAIPASVRRNFETLLAAARNGDLAVMECLDAATGETRHVICAIGRDADEYLITPFGHLASGNPSTTEP